MRSRGRCLRSGPGERPSANFVTALRDRVAGAVREGEPVARYSTYRIGGPATVLLPKTPADVAAALRLAGETGEFLVRAGSRLKYPAAR